jgi:hypothetical protein
MTTVAIVTTTTTDCSGSEQQSIRGGGWLSTCGDRRQLLALSSSMLCLCKAMGAAPGLP